MNLCHFSDCCQSLAATFLHSKDPMQLLESVQNDLKMMMDLPSLSSLKKRATLSAKEDSLNLATEKEHFKRKY